MQNICVALLQEGYHRYLCCHPLSLVGLRITNSFFIVKYEYHVKVIILLG